jgi:hypothetical protein
MKIVFRVLSILIGLGLLANGLGFLVDPAAAAESLGMELLSGVGASTQIGDISAFFVALAIMIALAQRPGESQWLYPATLLVAAAAVMRTLAWATGNAAFAPQFIVPEIVMATILFTAARLRADEPAASERVMQ